MVYNDTQRQRMSNDAKGKVIESMEWEPEGAHWVITFTDGSEISVLVMAELFHTAAHAEWERQVYLSKRSTE